MAVTGNDGGMARIPDVLSSSDLPYPELCAAQLDGELYRLDDTFMPIDGIDQPRSRALSLHTWAPSALIAERRTAAWIYGALDAPPGKHQFCVDIANRVRPERDARIALREVVFGDGDVVQLNGIRLTSPVRTIIDLARVPDEQFAGISPVIGRLAEQWMITIDDCLGLADRRRNLPGKRQALALISAVLPTAAFPTAVFPSAAKHERSPSVR